MSVARPALRLASPARKGPLPEPPERGVDLAAAVDRTRKPPAASAPTRAVSTAPHLPAAGGPASMLVSFRRRRRRHHRHCCIAPAPPSARPAPHRGAARALPPPRPGRGRAPKSAGGCPPPTILAPAVRPPGTFSAEGTTCNWRPTPPIRPVAESVPQTPISNTHTSGTFSAQTTFLLSYFRPHTGSCVGTQRSGRGAEGWTRRTRPCGAESYPKCSAFSPNHPGLSPVLSHADPVALLEVHGHAAGARFERTGLSACNSLPLPSCRGAR